MKRFIIILTILLVSLSGNAQGWIIDEASKENSGGIFSGLLGFVLLIGVVWFIGYISDIISEDKDIRERNRRNKRINEVTSPKISLQSSAQPTKLISDTINNVPLSSKMETEEDNDTDIEEFSQSLLKENNTNEHSVDAISLPTIITILPEHKKYLQKMKSDYALTERIKNDFKDAIIEWGKISESDIETPANAFYSSDGRKLLRCIPPRYNVKDGVEIITDYSMRETKKRVINLPSTVKVIGNNVFYHSVFASFVIPQSVEIITGNPFVGCAGLIGNSSPNFVLIKGVLYDKEKYRIISVLSYNIDVDYCFESSVIAIERYSFYGINDNRFPTIKLPSHVKYIGESAFEESKFREVKMSEGLIEIGKSAFRKSNIISVSLPKSLQKMGESTFKECTELEAVSIPNNITSIEEDTFFGCTKLNHVIIPEGVKYLKKNCFSRCESLYEIRLPNSLKRIKKHAFDNCPLTKVVLSRNTLVEIEAFPMNCEIEYRD